MRSTKTDKGYSVIVSNDEYRLLKKIDASGKILISSLQEYYQELGDKLYSRGVLNKIEHNGEEYFVSIKRSKNYG